MSGSARGKMAKHFGVGFVLALHRDDCCGAGIRDLAANQLQQRFAAQTGIHDICDGYAGEDGLARGVRLGNLDHSLIGKTEQTNCLQFPGAHTQLVQARCV